MTCPWALPPRHWTRCSWGGPVAVWPSLARALAPVRTGRLKKNITATRLKQSETPFSALALVELAHRAGIPKGVLSVVTGSAGDIGGELTSNPIVRKLSFTARPKWPKWPNNWVNKGAHDVWT